MLVYPRSVSVPRFFIGSVGRGVDFQHDIVVVVDVLPAVCPGSTVDQNRHLLFNSSPLGVVFEGNSAPFRDPFDLLQAGQAVFVIPGECPPLVRRRVKCSLDIFWLKDKSLADLDNLPEPDDLAAEIIENVEAGLNSFRSIVGGLA